MVGGRSGSSGGTDAPFVGHDRPPSDPALALPCACSSVGDYGGRPIEAHYELADATTTVIAMIEDREATMRSALATSAQAITWSSSGARTMRGTSTGSTSSRISM